VLTPSSQSAPLKLDPTTSLAESLVLRGARATTGGPCLPAAAAAALDAVLRSEAQRRCVVHRCVVGAALPVPLPFPGLFSGEVGAGGDVVATWRPASEAYNTAAGGGWMGGVNGGSALPSSSLPSSSSSSSSAAAAAARDGRHVSSCPVLARVVATSEFEPWLVERARGLIRASGSAAGRALAEGWGYGRGEVEEVGERLRRLAGSYREGDSDSGLE